MIVITTFTSRSIHLYHAMSIDDEVWFNEYSQAKIKDKYTIVVLMPIQGHGARMLAKRIDVAAKTLEWSSHLIEESENNIETIKQIKPDFIITTTSNYNLGPDVLPYNVYAYLTQSTRIYFGGIFSLKPKFKENKYPNLDKISGFMCSFKALSFLKDFKEKSGERFYGFRSFPCTQETKFEPLKFNSIVYFGSHYDKLRSSNRFKIFFKKLDEAGILNVYGPKEVWEYVPNAWRGQLDGDGWEIINRTKDYGISLLVHAKRFNKEGLPSGRIFEAVAASSIIICDKNDFVEKNFGDSVLYINQEKSANAMTEEVLKHVEWIKSHPKESVEKAKRAHEILIKNFTLENELVKIAKMHETIIANSN